MPTRAQASRDAALRRLTRVNRSLAAAALVGAGVLTEVVASTATSHARTTDALTTAPRSVATHPVADRVTHAATDHAGHAVTHHVSHGVTHAATDHAGHAVTHDRHLTTVAASAPSTATSSAPAVVAVSGGS